MKQSASLVDYHSLFDHMLDGLAYCHLIFDGQNLPIDATFIEVNKNYEKLMGVNQLAGKNMTDVFLQVTVSHPEILQAYGRVSLTGRPERLQVYMSHLCRWFLISVHSPRPTYIIAIFQNITGQKHTEKELENAKIAARNVLEDLQLEKETLAHQIAKDQAMLTSIGDGVIIVDVEGKITFVNQSASGMLGWEEKDMLGKSLFQIAPVGSDYFVRKDKTRFPVARNFSNVMLDNVIIGAIEVFRDITREKEIDRAKSEFVSLASHQLKNPPTAIKLLAERILRGRVGSLTLKQREYFDDIYSANQRMIDLVNTLLNVSHIELGAFTMQWQKKDIALLVRNIVDEFQSAIDKKQLTLTQVYEKPAKRLLTDGSFFRMAVNNLILNAISYTPQKGAIHVECKQMHRGQLLGKKWLKEPCLAISISDTGCGIPQHQQDKLFTKFFRGDNARENQPDGTGLGLYIVKSVLDSLGASVWFNSKENKGSTFYVTLPM